MHSRRFSTRRPPSATSKARSSLIADDVDWLVQGPVDVFPFLGQRHGKAAVREGYRDIGRKLEITSYEVEALLVDGDRSAALIRISSIVRATGRVMSVRTSQFARFRNGKIVEMRAVIDTYDMVEQTLGRSLGACTPGHRAHRHRLTRPDRRTATKSAARALSAACMLPTGPA